MVISSQMDGTIPVLPTDELTDPFGKLRVDISDSELRETAYEILVGACRSTGGKPLTYVRQSQRTAAGERSPSFSSAPSLQRSLTSAAASKVKKALGLKSSKKRDSEKTKTPVTVGELIRVQMRVSEQTDSRIRRGLLRISAGQLGRRMESMVLPLELLQQIKPSDFPNQLEYEAWQRRNLKVLEAGLLLHPHMPLDKTDTTSQRLRQMIHGFLERPTETRKQNESMQVLRSIGMSLACRSLDSSVSEMCHWADGSPFNLCLYQTLLESCFDVNEETSIVEEVDEVLELIKKTWVILGINQMLHNLCFSWVLFRRFVATGQLENDLLFAASNLLEEVEKDAKETNDSVYSRVLDSVLSLVIRWSERRLLAYHNNFYSGNINVMQVVVSLATSAAKLLVDDISSGHGRRRKVVDVACNRVDNYIRSSVKTAFIQNMEKVKSSKQSTKNQQNPLPVLSILAQDITELALYEKETYSPILKRWHPLAAGAAVATLHACYGYQLKQFVSGINELSPDVVQVLLAADKLEKVLVQIAVEDSVDSEDGGKAIIQEMIPYEAESEIASLVKAWIKTRVDRLKEWVDRNLQQEVWNPQANKERIAPSAVEVLRIMDETIEAFFLLPMTMHTVLLPELLSGLDQCLQQYILKIKSGCGNRNTFMPTMPDLTRCRTGSKLFKKREKSHTVQRRKPQIGNFDGNNTFGILQLCVCINTLHHIRAVFEVLGRKITEHLRNTRTVHLDDIASAMGKYFELSKAACLEGIQQLCETAAYKVVFHDLSHVLWDGLYVGEVSSSRIEPFLQELDQQLEIISATVHDRVRTRVITDVMRASFDGFLFVLLAGGPSRAFSRQDYDALEEDFRFLKDLFWSNGDGLPAELIEKLSITVRSVLSLFHADTKSLVDRFTHAIQDSYGFSSKSKFPLPPTSGQWSPTEPSTLLRVLCYRNDELATKFLKKTYNLPKKL
ncbi:hypothetical protein NMG60_11021907 [Bertholletia excelsa]